MNESIFVHIHFVLVSQPSSEQGLKRSCRCILSSWRFWVDSPPSFRSTLSSVDQLSFCGQEALTKVAMSVSCGSQRAGCCGLHSWLRRLACRQWHHFRLAASHSIHVLATQTTWVTVTTTHFGCIIVMTSCICNKHTL